MIQMYACSVVFGYCYVGDDYLWAGNGNNKNTTRHFCLWTFRRFIQFVQSVRLWNREEMKNEHMVVSSLF